MMPDRYRARVDRSRCYSYGRCLETLPEVFELDEDGTALARPVDVPLQALIEVADTCPLSAISVVEADAGEVVY